MTDWNFGAYERWKAAVTVMALTKLERNAQNKFICPTCGQELQFVDGTAVQIVGGRADMSSILPKHECWHCGVYYQEVLNSGFYDVFPLAKPAHKMLSTGDIPPMELKREADGKCTCPRCGERMDYIEGGAVKIVDGRADFDDVKDHFHCSYCNSMFRRIAATNYFQWFEK